MKQSWSEGRAGAGIPFVAFAGVGLVASLPLQSISVGSASTVVMLLAATVESGFEVDGDCVRSWIGWGRMRIGRWRKKPRQFQWSMRRTRESLMNRRGAPNAVGIDSWELGWVNAAGEWKGVHEFTDRKLAQVVSDLLVSQAKG